jgi:disulfide bond formation protein DsbB
MRETMDTPGLLRQLYNQAMNARGDCALVDWSFLGLSMPAWSLVWFVLLGAWALFAGFHGRRRKN